jgi:preprotein translocase subunit SecA
MLGPDPDDWDLRGLFGELRTFFPLPADFNYHRWDGLSAADIEDQLAEWAEKAYDDINQKIGREIYRQALREDVTLETLAQSPDPTRRLVYRRLAQQGMVERIEESAEGAAAQPIRRLADEAKARVEAAFLDAYCLMRDRRLMLRAVDGLWVRHLTDLDGLREGIGLRAYGQQNPLVAYRKEAYEMYEALLSRIQETVARSAYLVPQALVGQPRRQRLQASRPSSGRRQETRPAREQPQQSLGRNDPCWCGSGKKYKQCHMRQDMAGQIQPAIQQGRSASERSQKPSGQKRRRR